ncbi:MAG TPA: hypothetical protein PLO33_00605 [Kouleothrix sp.]|uniref:hypothetical protein n=1 Tax=Kouleothrix sp. TaxID=2779161 RepID=UPI002C6BA7DF|nr:hypothetical protein [Kouleothrix sp.]HRC74142.1 hypothetical protein [Kouleothrix sp.]
MAVTNQIALTPALVAQAGQHIRAAMRERPAIEAAALCALNGQCLWASSAAFEHAAPTIAKIGIMSLRLWVKVRTGKLDRIGLVTDDGMVDIIFVPPIASVLVISGGGESTAWLEDEPDRLLAALGL